MKTCLIVLCAAMTISFNERAAGAPAQARLQGTFVQLTRANADWDAARWEQLFAQLRDMGLHEIVVQWTVLDDLAFYPSKAHPSSPHSPLDTIFTLADHAGMTVVVGLAYDSQYWTHIDRDSTLVDVYLRRLQLRSQTVARELAPETRNHPSFAGWYVPEEIDDVNWMAPRSREVLIHHLRHLTETLHALSPAPVALSGFSNGNMDPERLASLWKDLATKSGIDRLMFQDGVGAGKMAVEDLDAYYSALRRALDGSCQFQIIVETFTQLEGQPFKAKPATLDRIQRQLDLAAHHSVTPLLAFSAPEYMTPAGGPDAAQLYEEYLALLKHER